MKHGELKQGERGIALVVALFMVLAVALLGATALHLAAQEIESVASLREDAAGRHLAEAGAHLVVSWMHAPSTVPSPDLRQVLSKRAGVPETGASFFDADGRSQFHGTSDQPDVLFDARRAEDDALLNDPANGWFRAIRAQGRVTELKIFAPTRPDALCTVEVAASGSARSSDTPQRVRIELAALPMPPVRAAVQTSSIEPIGTTASSVLAHWGSVQVVGEATVPSWADVPVRTGTASVTGQSYWAMPEREDRWLEMAVGGTVKVLQYDARYPSMPLNVSQQQLPVPGLKLDRWEYDTLKKIAKSHGSYYVVDQEGHLHAGTVSSTDRGLSLDEVMHSGFVGEHRGLVFVDTLDQQAPRPDNLPSLTAEVPYAEGLFVVNAHLTWRPRGLGHSLPVLSPPTGETTAIGARVPVQLSPVHLNGVLYVSGALKIEEPARVFGAVLTDGPLTAAGLGLEVWYNEELRSGSYRGLPLVFVAPGSWRTV